MARTRFAALLLSLVALVALGDGDDHTCEQGCQNPTGKSEIEFSQFEEINFSEFRDRIHDAVGKALADGEALLKVEELFCTEVITHPHRRVVSKPGDMSPAAAARITVPITVEDDETGQRRQKCIAIDIYFRDVDECTSSHHPHQCSPHSACVNTLGSYTCVCDAGYASVDPSDPHAACEDIDECALEADVCGGVAECASCENTDGSFVCALRDEVASMYTADNPGNVTECIVRDVCAEIDPCGSSAVCTGTDTAPFYSCECKPEFHDRSANGDGSLCVPRGICEKHGAMCSPQADCMACVEATEAVRARGAQCAEEGVMCACRNPYFGNGFGGNGCNRVCDQDTATLSEDGTACTCKPGYTPRVGSEGWERHDGPGCVDIDECAVDFAAQRAVGNTQYLNEVTHLATNYTFTPCNPLAVCTNTRGGYSCACREDIAKESAGTLARGEAGCITDLVLVPRANFVPVSDEGHHTHFRTVVKQLSAFHDEGVTVRHRSAGAVQDSTDDLMDVIRSQLRTVRDFVVVETTYHPRLRHRASVMESVGYIANAINFTLYQGTSDNRRVHHRCTVDVEILDSDETMLAVNGEVGETDLKTYDGSVIPAQFAPQCDDRAFCSNTNGSYDCACATGFRGFSCAPSVLRDWEAGLYDRTPYRRVYKPECLRRLEADIAASPAKREAFLAAARKGCVARGTQRHDLIGPRARVIEDCRCSDDTLRVRDIPETGLCSDNDRAERVETMVVEVAAARAAVAACRSAVSEETSPHSCRRRGGEAECLLAESNLAFLEKHLGALQSASQACHTFTCSGDMQCQPTITAAHLEAEEISKFADDCLSLGVNADICQRVQESVHKGACATATCGNGIAVQKISYSLDGREVAARFAITLAVDVLQRVQELVQQTVTLETDSSAVAREVQRALKSTGELDANFKKFVTTILYTLLAVVVFVVWYFHILSSFLTACSFLLTSASITDHDEYVEAYEHYVWWFKRGMSGIRAARAAELEWHGREE